MRNVKELAKVPIGTGYRPELRHKPTPEELEIQGYLLRRPGRRRLSDGFIAVLCIVIVVLLGLAL